MSIIPPTGSTGTNTTNTPTTPAVDSGTLAGNFTTFLTLLTTQLKNQNPLEPLDTNQFTAQLVQFAQVEQQMKQNEQLASLVSMSKSAEATTALAFVGATVVVDGATTDLGASGASWMFNVAKPASATLTIKDSTGQTVYTGKTSVNPGDQKFTWDGRGNDGKAWPAGNYTLTATAIDANNQSVAISTEIQAVVESVDLTETPPQLMIAGKEYTSDKIKRVLRYVPPVETPPPAEDPPAT